MHACSETSYDYSANEEIGKSKFYDGPCIVIECHFTR